MDPQVFVRLSIGSLGLRIPLASSPKALQVGGRASSSPCLCEIRLRGFPVQTASVPLISSPEANPDPHSTAIVLYLEEANVKALMAPKCFQAPQAHLEIVIYTGRHGSNCGFSSKKQQIGIFRLEVGPEWSEGRSVLLHNGWIEIGKKGEEIGYPKPELHLTVKLDPDPRYVFQFEDETVLSPQIVQLQGSNKQPIFTCKFNRDRRGSQLDSNYWPSSSTETDQDIERRERKGWKVMIHDLAGSAVAVAFMATPFVPATGGDRVARSNPGAWLILHPDPMGPPDSWQPWARLEAWRESGSRDFVSFRLHLLPEGQEGAILVLEALLSTDKGGEFSIDMDRQQRATDRKVSGNGDGTVKEQSTESLGGSVPGGFVMNCRVQGEGKSSKPLVQLAKRHVTCVEDAAIFMALAAAVDLSIEACKPFRRKPKRVAHHSF